MALSSLFLLSIFPQKGKGLSDETLSPLRLNFVYMRKTAYFSGRLDTLLPAKDSSILRDWIRQFISGDDVGCAYIPREFSSRSDAASLFRLRRSSENSTMRS